MLGLALAHVELRERLSDLSSELRFMAVSARALAAEALDAPVSLHARGPESVSFAGERGILFDSLDVLPEP